MDDFRDAFPLQVRKLHAAAYVAAQDGLTDEEIAQVVADGVAEARHHAEVRAAGTIEHRHAA